MTTCHESSHVCDTSKTPEIRLQSDSSSDMASNNNWRSSSLGRLLFFRPLGFWRVLPPCQSATSICRETWSCCQLFRSIYNLLININYFEKSYIIRVISLQRSVLCKHKFIDENNITCIHFSSFEWFDEKILLFD